MIKKIYLASPMGFSETGRHFMYEKIIPVLESVGWDILNPWELAPKKELEKVSSMPRTKERKKEFSKINKNIGAINTKAIENSDCVFAILDGVDVDSGTASEIGYACALKKPIIGYRSDFRLSADNEGAKVNLQVEYFITKSKGKMIQTISELKESLESIKF